MDGELIEQLCLAARAGKVEKILSAIEGGISVNATDATGRTLLHWAASGGRGEAVQALIEKGANVNAKTPEGWTPLHMATGPGHGFHRVATLLEEAGAISTPAPHRPFWGRGGR